MTRVSPTKTEFLDALAGALGASTSAAQALGLVSAAGPESARTARRITDELTRSSLARALSTVGLLAPDEVSAAELAERAGRLDAALAWVIERERGRHARRRALRDAIMSPLSLAALMLITEPIPAMIMGGGSIRPAVLNTLLLLGGAAFVVVGAPWMFSHPSLGAKLRSALAKIPFVGDWVRHDAEDATAAVLASFSRDEDLGCSIDVAALVVHAPFDHALTRADAQSLPRAPSFSEAFGLALAVGVRARDLPRRFAKFHQRARQQLTARLAMVARLFAFAVAGAVAVHGVTQMLTGSLPGIGGDLGNSAEMKQLERELDSILH